MLKLKPNRECCDRDLPPESAEARICTFECTFCATCADTVFGGVLLGYGNKPGEVLNDASGLAKAATFFAQSPARLAAQ